MISLKTFFQSSYATRTVLLRPKPARRKFCARMLILQQLLLCIYLPKEFRQRINNFHGEKFTSESDYTHHTQFLTKRVASLLLNIDNSLSFLIFFSNFLPVSAGALKNILL
jgi:hypothetical protein